jgi:hypothetical protein
MKHGTHSERPERESLFDVLIHMYGPHSASKEPVVAPQVAKTLARRGYKVSIDQCRPSCAGSTDGTG